MYDTKCIVHVGEHDYDQESAKRFAFLGKTFSVNIFKWMLKNNQKEMKRSSCIVRVSGPSEKMEEVFTLCELIVEQLDKGKWDGRKTVTIK